MKLKIKDQIPDIEIFHLIDGEPQTSKIRDILGNGKVVLFGLPGAFTSTCSKLHLPGYVANADKIKAKGIDNIFCLMRIHRVNHLIYEILWTINYLSDIQITIFYTCIE